MRTPENVIAHELVGMRARIVSSANGSLVGLNGTVADETKSMIYLDTAGGRRSAPKEGSVWGLSAPGCEAEVAGSLLSGRPHDRVGARWPRT